MISVKYRGSTRVIGTMTARRACAGLGPVPRVPLSATVCMVAVLRCCAGPETAQRGRALLRVTAVPTNRNRPGHSRAGGYLEPSRSFSSRHLKSVEASLALPIVVAGVLLLTACGSQKADSQSDGLTQTQGSDSPDLPGKSSCGAQTCDTSAAPSTPALPGDPSGLEKDGVKITSLSGGARACAEFRRPRTTVKGPATARARMPS
jgi:hypothetical protein